MNPETNRTSLLRSTSLASSVRVACSLALGFGGDSKKAKPRGKKRSKDSRANVRKALASDVQAPHLVRATAGMHKVRGKGRTSGVA